MPSCQHTTRPDISYGALPHDGPAMREFNRRIEEEFGESARSRRMARRRKAIARETIAEGPYSRFNQLRYGELALAGRNDRIDLDGALALVKHWRRLLERSNGRPIKLWAHSFLRITPDMVANMALILRFVRRYEPHLLPDILDKLTTPAPVARVAAE